MTSKMRPALLGDPSTLNTSMGHDMLWVLIPLEQTKFLLIKLPVTLQSSRALMEWTLLVSVIWSLTGRIKEAL